MVLGHLLAGIFALVGLLGILGVLQPVRLLQTLISTGVSESDAVGSDRVGIIGTVESNDSLVRAPLSGRECVGYVVDREVKHRTGGTGFGLLFPRWHRKDVRYEFPSLYLAGGQGPVRVEFDGDGDSWQTQVPDGLFSNVQLGADERVRCKGDEPTPEAVRPVIGSVPNVSSAGSVFGIGSHPHRYTEWRFEPGDRLYVLGHGVDDESEPTVRTRIDDDVLIDLESNGRLRLLGLLAVRLLTAGALASFGFGAVFVLW